MTDRRRLLPGSTGPRPLVRRYSDMNFQCSGLEVKGGIEGESNRREGIRLNDIVVQGAVAKHRIPVIDRMMDVLALLERSPDGATIREMVEALGLPPRFSPAS